MDALVFRGKCRVAVERVPAPQLEAPGDAIVRIDLAAVCGSDLRECLPAGWWVRRRVPPPPRVPSARECFPPAQSELPPPAPACPTEIADPYHCREEGLDEGTVMGHEFMGHVCAVGEPGAAAGLERRARGGWPGCCPPAFCPSRLATQYPRLLLGRSSPPRFANFAGPGVQRFKPGDRVMSPFTVSCGACFYCQRGLTARCDGVQGACVGAGARAAGACLGRRE